MRYDDDYDYYETREERRARRNRGKKIRKRVMTVLLILVLILMGIIVWFAWMILRGQFFTDRTAEPAAEGSSFSFHYVGEITQPYGTTFGTSGEISVAQEIPAIYAEGIYSTNALMIRLSDQAVLLDIGADEQIYPASMTKMMTVLIALEELDNYDAAVTVTSAEIDPSYTAGAALAGFSPGETVSLRDLMYGAMLPSGAEACTALAKAVAGTEEAFVEMMNDKARELGMKNTHFVTTTGLHDPQHYSTCEDMAILLEAGLANSTFREILTTHTYTTSQTAEHPDGIRLTHSLFASLVNDKLLNDTVIEGGKTGYTGDAKHCLASLARSASGEEFILITAHADSSTENNPNISDAVTLYSQLP